MNNKHHFLKNKCCKVTREVRKYFELNENEKKAYQNFENIAKVILRGKFIAFNAYNRKENKSQTNNLSFLLKKLKI